MPPESGGAGKGDQIECDLATILPPTRQILTLWSGRQERPYSEARTSQTNQIFRSMEGAGWSTQWSAIGQELSWSM